MSKATQFTNELITSRSPEVWRRGYLHRKLDGDANGRISSFHDVKTAYKGDYDADKLFIYSDLHYTDWDHSYGTEYAQSTVEPDDTTFLSEAWSTSIAGSASSTVVNGVLKIKCPTASTIVYTKSNVFDTVSAATADTLGSFTLEFEFRKGTDEASNANPFVVRLNCGTFQTTVTCNLTTITLAEVGGSTATLSNVNLADATWASQEGEDPTDDGVETGGAVEYGGTHIIRVVIDKKRATKHAVMYVDGVERASITHAVNNTTANSVSFGYSSAPTSRSFSYIGYMRYHNASFLPVDTYDYVYNANGGIISSSTNEPDDFTLTGTMATNVLEILSGTKNKNVNHLVNTTDGATLILSSVTQAGSIGNAAEFRFLLNGSNGTNLTINHYDGTYKNSMIVLANSTISFNGTNITPAANIPHTYRMVQRNGTAYLYVDGVLQTTNTPTASATASKFEFIFNGVGIDIDLYYVRLMKRPGHPTRTSNQIYIAIGNNTAESTYYYRSDVTNNALLDDITDEPVTAYVLQKDLCWGESGFESDLAMSWRGSASSFAKGDASPSYTTVTASSGLSHRDAFTEYKYKYFQTKVEITKQTQELNYMRYCRQMCISDLVESWGFSTFDRDVNTRRIEAGSVSLKLSNGANEFNTYKNAPEKWGGAIWETWIGVTVSGTEYAYPDFVGELADMIFEYGVPYVTFEVTNIIKNLKDIELGRQFQYPPYSKQKVFYGNACYKVETRPSTSNSDQNVETFIFYIDSKYNLSEIDKVYVNGRMVFSDNLLLDSENYTSIQVNTNSPCSISITPVRTGTPPNDRPSNTPSDVTADIIPLFPKNLSNPGKVLRDILKVEGKLLTDYDIDTSAFTTYENEIEGIDVSNIEISQEKMFDFIEKLAVQTASSVYLSPDTQTGIAIERFAKGRADHFSIAHENLSESIPGCGDIRQRNPIENVLTLVDVEYDATKQKKFYTYRNTNTVGLWDQTSSNAAKKVLDLFGVRTPSKRFQQTNIQQVPTDYTVITDIDDISTLTQRNFEFYGYRPPVYELLNCHPDIFIYSFRDILYIHDTNTTTPFDTIEITRIEKDYDNLTGTIQGISNKLFQFPGGVGINRAYAVDDTVCVASVTSPCDITGQTINDDYWVASDTAGDSNVAYATT